MRASKLEVSSDFHYREGEQDILTSSVPIDDSALITINSLNTEQLLYSVDGGPWPTPKDVLMTLSYQSIMEAFNAMITGTVYAQADGAEAGFDTAIANTVLMYSSELQFLLSPLPHVLVTDDGSLKERSVRL